jgi:ribosomal protein S18 acetylase RimI-like enzyme
MAVVVRAADKGDLPDVVRIWAAAGGPTRSPASLDEAAELLRFDPTALLVGEHLGEVAGTLIVGYDGWRVHLYRLAVLEAHRRAGIARALVEYAIAQVRSRGVKRIDAMVDGSNHLGIAFWPALGFDLDEVEQRWSLALRR